MHGADQDNRPQPRQKPGWTRTARVLHWGVALAILIEVPMGYTMAWTYALARKTGSTGAQVHLRASQAHHTIGMLVLLTVVFRLYWRARNRAPQLVSGPQLWTARAVQALLYALLLLVPLSGWAALSSLGAGAGYPAPAMWFFGFDGFAPGGFIPHIVPPVAWNAPTLWRYGTFSKAHVWMIWLGGGVLTVHILAALYHHFVRRDGVLRAMVSDTAS